MHISIIYIYYVHKYTQNYEVSVIYEIMGTSKI